MNCRQVRDWFDDFLERNPGMPVVPDAVDGMAEHLKTCRACRMYLEDVVQPLIDAGTLPAPPLSPDVKSRIARSLRSSGMEGPVWFLLKPLAALAVCCLFFVAGYRFGGLRNGLPGPGPAVTGTVPVQPWMNGFGMEPGDGMACRYYGDLSGNPGQYMASTGEIRRHEIDFPDRSSLEFPSQLVSHGRYRLDTRHMVLSDAEACIAFVSPVGDSLMLHLRRAAAGQASPEQTYVVRENPDRVLGYSVTWAMDGWICTMSGRLPPDYLLGLAKELAITAA